MSDKKKSKELIRCYFLANIGKVIESKALQEASGWRSEWARRVRELRDEEGYQIMSHKDREDLKPGQYLLATAERRPPAHRGITKETRAARLLAQVRRAPAADQKAVLAWLLKKFDLSRLLASDQKR
jgi:hypothetical protein